LLKCLTEINFIFRGGGGGRAREGSWQAGGFVKYIING
jgi:hypothetical protein